VLQTLLTVREVAARLAVSTATVYALCERGELPHARVANSIRVAESDLAAYLGGVTTGCRQRDTLTAKKRVSK
jgi:excisionase family DNA binding protein